MQLAELTGRVTGLVTESGELVRIDSPHLRTALGRTGIATDELKPMRRKDFERMCKHDGLQVKEVIESRWSNLESSRHELIETLLKSRAKLIAKEEAKLATALK